MADVNTVLDAVRALVTLAVAREATTPNRELNELRDAAQAKLDALQADLGTVTLPRY